MTFYNPNVTLVTVANFLVVALVTSVYTCDFTCQSCFEVLRSKGFYLPMGLTTKFRRAPLSRRRVTLGYEYNISFKKRDIEKKRQVTMPFPWQQKVENPVIFAQMRNNI